MVTVRATRLQERHGRALELVGGSVMVTVGVTIATVPRLLDDAGGVVGGFGAALGLSGLVAISERSVRTRAVAGRDTLSSSSSKAAHHRPG